LLLSTGRFQEQISCMIYSRDLFGKKV